MVGSHAQGLDKELDGLVNAVLIIQTEAADIQGVRIGRVHSQNIATQGQTALANIQFQHGFYQTRWLGLSGSSWCTWLQTEPQGSVPAGPSILPSGSWTCGSLVRTPGPGPCRTQPGNHQQVFFHVCVQKKKPILSTVALTILKSLFSNPISAILSYSRMDSEFFSWKQMLKKCLIASSGKFKICIHSSYV